MSLQSFQASDLKFHQFLSAVRHAIGGRELGKIVNLEAPPESSCAPGSGFTLRVMISKMGTSHLNFQVSPASDGAGFTARLESEKIALAHRPFRSDIESKLARVLTSCGATVNSSCAS